MSDNIISFKKHKRLFKQQECLHYNILIDKSLYNIECADCGQLIDPIWYLGRMATNESMAETRLADLRDACLKLKSRLRTKCTHCGKMTRIS